MRTDEVLRGRYGAATDLRFISLIAHLCDSRGCLAYVNGDRLNGLMAQDYGHLTRTGSRYVTETIVAPALVPLLR
jgi:hypothetical protein